LKILRIRRGFTTNSSASSEWIPTQSAGPGGAETPVSFRENALKVGGLFGLVVFLIAIRQVGKRLWRRRKENPDGL
jgi:hypothetical protein